MPLQYAANATVDISVQAVEISLNMSPSSADTTVHIVSEEETVILPVYGSDSAPITTGNLSVITTLEFEDTDHVIQPPVDGYKTVKIDPLPSTEEESFTLDLLPVQLVPFIFEVQTDNLVYHDYDYYIFTNNQYEQRTTDPNHATLSLQVVDESNGLRLTEITWLPSATPSPGAAVISSPADSYTLPTVDGGVYNCTVEWGDGTTSTITSWNQSEVTHQYPSAGKYRIKISGQFEGINFHRHEELNHHDHLKLLDVISWGDDSKMDIAGYVSPFNPHGVISDGSGGFMTQYVGMFCGCKNWNDISGGAPNWGTCGTAKTRHPDGDGRKFGGSPLITIFYGNSSLQADISVWTTEDRPFTGNAYRHFETRPRASDIDTFKANFHWLVGNSNHWKMFTNRSVVSAEGNSLLRSNRNSRFEVSNWKLDPAVQNIGWQTTFNGNLNMDPDVSNLVGPKVNTVAYIFNGADSFTGRGLENWDISGIDTNNGNGAGFTQAFAGTAINKILPWNFAFGARLNNMLFNCELYDSPCNGWDTSGVYQASGLFNEASSFNNGGVSWTDADWTNCQTFGSMFKKTLFNQDVSRWKLSTTRDFSMKSMFMQTPFNRPVNTTVVDGVKYWDMSRCTNTSSMFYGCGSFNQPLDAWDMSNVTDISTMFYHASQFNQPLNTWNTSNVTNMSSLFYDGNDTHNFNQPLSNWDTSKVTQMQQLFRACRSFNHPLVTDGNKWDVSKVTNMSGMFYHCNAFNQPLNSWDVSSVVNFSNTFNRATAFNQPLSNWDTSSATNMSGMFTYAPSFNQDLSTNGSKWDVSNVTNMDYMFIGATAFEGQGLSTWDVSSVESMSHMLYNCDSLPSTLDLSSWDVSNVKKMDHMFYDIDGLNHNIAGWVTSSLTTTRQMFYSNNAFNRDLSNWDMSNVTDARTMFQNCNLFNQDLSGWNLSGIVQITDGDGVTGTVSTGNSTNNNGDYSSGIMKIFQNTGMSKTNLDATISDWCDNSGIVSGAQLGTIPLDNSGASERLDDTTISKMRDKNMTAQYTDGTEVTS